MKAKPLKIAEPNISLRSWLWYETVFWTSGVGLTLFSSLRTRGLQNVPPTGPVLFIANHQSYLDPVLVGLAVRRHLSYLARKSLFRHPLFALLIRSLHAVPLDQDGLGIEGLRKTLQLLQEGRAVVVYPEGERTGDGQIQPLQPGIHLLIKKTQARVVPVGVAGAFDAWPKFAPLPVPAPLFLPPLRATIAVEVGQALDAERLLQLPREAFLEAVHQEMSRVHARAERLRRKDRR